MATRPLWQVVKLHSMQSQQQLRLNHPQIQQSSNIDSNRTLVVSLHAKTKNLTNLKFF